MKKFGTIVTIAILTLAGWGCTTGNNLSQAEKDALKAKENIVISGKTGAIVGTEQDKHPSKVICKNCGFPTSSLRHRMIIDGDGYKLTPEEVKVLKTSNNVLISSETGSIVGTEQDKHPSKIICKNCGFPAGSLRYRMIIYED